MVRGKIRAVLVFGGVIGSTSAARWVGRGRISQNNFPADSIYRCSVKIQARRLRNLNLGSVTAGTRRPSTEKTGPWEVEPLGNHCHRSHISPTGRTPSIILDAILALATHGSLPSVKHHEGGIEKERTVLQVEGLDKHQNTFFSLHVAVMMSRMFGPGLMQRCGRCSQ